MNFSAAWFHSWYQALLDIILPPRCPHCGRSQASFGQWCAPCQNHYMVKLLLTGEDRGLFYVDQILLLADYQGAVRQKLQALKYGQRPEAARYLQAFLPKRDELEQFFPVLTESATCSFMPVPIHQAKRRQRGYNQTEVIFATWVKAMFGDAYWQTELLVRLRPTAPQYFFKPMERRENVKGAFYVTRPSQVKDQTIFLVDDIFTSGATIDACAHTLLAAGAKAVSAVVLASSAR
ncbi:MAG: phosphoribosyltransferase family protein [Sporomusaceae bacterium]|nr:phosphoribosyltransferase family protein [Sporomusaceae bacterium]